MKAIREVNKTSLKKPKFKDTMESKDAIKATGKGDLMSDLKSRLEKRRSGVEPTSLSDKIPFEAHEEEEDNSDFD